MKHSLTQWIAMFHREDPCTHEALFLRLQAHSEHRKQQQQPHLVAATTTETAGTKGGAEADGAIPTGIASHH
jgi:hypothetical protein